MSTATGAERTLFSIDGSSASRLASDEAGSELMFKKETSVYVTTFAPGPSDPGYRQAVLQDTRACVVDVRNLRTGALKSTLSGIDCLATDHGLGFAPVRIPVSNP